MSNENAMDAGLRAIPPLPHNLRITQPLLKTIVELDDGECKPKPGYSPKEPTMSNDVNNLAHSFVAMAQAFEQLPIVKADLDLYKARYSEALEQVQRLELRLLDRANEITSLNETVRKVEVERDHAERMFLETDDRLNAFRRLVQAFDTDVKSLVQAAEPEPEVKPEDLSSVVEQMNAAAEPEPKPEPTIAPSTEQSKEIMAGWAQSQPEPGPAVGDAFNLGQGDTTPTEPSSTTSGGEATGETSLPSVEGSVQPDPTPATPDAQHSPAGSSASAGESNATTETAGSTQPEHMQGSIATGDWGRPIAGNGNGDPSEVAAPAATMESGGLPVNTQANEEAPHPVDPTVSSTAGDGHSPHIATPTLSAEPQADAPTSEQPKAMSSDDDVGYHNEPKIGVGGGAEAWAEWDKWCERMNKRYPATQGGWPPRSQAAQ